MLQHFAGFLPGQSAQINYMKETHVRISGVCDCEIYEHCRKCDPDAFNQPAFRFLYRRIEANKQHTVEAWCVLTSSLTSRDAADHLVANWNKRDAHKFEWKHEPCLPDSFDYPCG
jgi:hypothetical protein